MSEFEYRQELAHHVMVASQLADWIYHDVRLDCDGEARKRTAERLKVINKEHGQDIMFGVAGWWAIKTYKRLLEAHQIVGIARRPELLPMNIEDILNSDESDEQKRAFVGAQQFISTMTHNNEATAKAIFDVAYAAGVEEFVALMYSVLVLSIRNSNIAMRLRAIE